MFCRRLRIHWRRCLHLVCCRLNHCGQLLRLRVGVRVRRGNDSRGLRLHAVWRRLVRSARRQLMLGLSRRHIRCVRRRLKLPVVRQWLHYGLPRRQRRVAVYLRRGDDTHWHHMLGVCGRVVCAARHDLCRVPHRLLLCCPGRRHVHRVRRGLHHGSQYPPHLLLLLCVCHGLLQQRRHVLAVSCGLRLWRRQRDGLHAVRRGQLRCRWQCDLRDLCKRLHDRVHWRKPRVAVRVRVWLLQQRGCVLAVRSRHSVRGRQRDRMHAVWRGQLCCRWRRGLRVLRKRLHDDLCGL